MENSNPSQAGSPERIRFLSDTGELDLSSIGANLSPEAREKMKVFMSHLKVDQFNAFSGKWGKKIIQQVAGVPGFDSISNASPQLPPKAQELNPSPLLKEYETYRHSLLTGQPMVPKNQEWPITKETGDSDKWRIFVFILALIVALLALLGVPLDSLLEGYFFI